MSARQPDDCGGMANARERTLPGWPAAMIDVSPLPRLATSANARCAYIGRLAILAVAPSGVEPTWIAGLMNYAPRPRRWRATRGKVTLHRRPPICLSLESVLLSPCLRAHSRGLHGPFDGFRRNRTPACMVSGGSAADFTGSLCSWCGCCGGCPSIRYFDRAALYLEKESSFDNARPGILARCCHG